MVHAEQFSCHAIISFPLLPIRLCLLLMRECALIMLEIRPTGQDLHDAVVVGAFVFLDE